MTLSQHVCSESTVAPLRNGQQSWGLTPTKLEAGDRMMLHVLREDCRTTADVTGEVIEAVVIESKKGALPPPDQWETRFRSAK